MQTERRDIIIFLVITTTIILLLAALIVSLFYLYQKKQLTYKKKLDSLKLDHEKNLMAAQLEIQENTFQHISREIHDNISLALTLAKLNLNTLDRDNDENCTIKINASIDLITKTIHELSDISKSLNSDMIRTHGLIMALENEIQLIRNTGLFAIHFTVVGDPVYMDTRKELIIFRMIQEAFNNIIKHALATETQLKLEYIKQGLNITVRDNGIGIHNTSKDKLILTNRAGLNNMAIRSTLLEGKMTIENQRPKGTVIFFYIPF